MRYARCLWAWSVVALTIAAALTALAAEPTLFNTLRDHSAVAEFLELTSIYAATPVRGSERLFPLPGGMDILREARVRAAARYASHGFSLLDLPCGSRGLRCAELRSLGIHAFGVDDFADGSNQVVEFTDRFTKHTTRTPLFHVPRLDAYGSLDEVVAAVVDETQRRFDRILNVGLSYNSGALGRRVKIGKQWWRAPRELKQEARRAKGRLLSEFYDALEEHGMLFIGNVNDFELVPLANQVGFRLIRNSPAYMDKIPFVAEMMTPLRYLVFEKIPPNEISLLRDLSQNPQRPFLFGFPVQKR